jgi:phosphatidylserine/phosphatidylglycerophosphate/cardiolipin synthase-like enzyme
VCAFPSSKTLLYAKVLVSDRRMALIGSANLTPDESASNHEIGALVRVREQVEALATPIRSLTETLPAR